ncbi:MAG: hypothetical protein J6O18_04050, partial [Bacilli bacterium]|nr:hypothetical protein [Bacilli bacterium]
AFTLTRAGPPSVNQETSEVTYGSSPDYSKTKLAYQKPETTLQYADSGSLAPVNAKQSQTVLRTTYYEVNVASMAVIRTVLTQIDNGAITIDQKKYSEESGEWAETDNTKVYDEDGNPIYDQSVNGSNTSSLSIVHTSYGENGAQLSFYYLLENGDTFNVISDVIRTLNVAELSEDETYFTPTGFRFDIEKNGVDYEVHVTRQENTYYINVRTGTTRTGITQTPTEFEFTYTINPS